MTSYMTPNNDKDEFPISPYWRRYIYRLVLACAPLAVILGFTDNETAGLAVAVIAAALGGGLALPNVDD